VRLIVQSVARLLLSAGLAALMAVLFVMNVPSPEWARWMAPIRQISLAIGIPLLAAAIVASVVLPRRREPAGAVGGSLTGDGLNVLAVLPFVLLAAIALWQVPLVLAWWAESQRLIQQIPGERDRIGFWIIPTILISAPPTIAGLIIFTFILATIASATGSVTSRPRLLAACVVLSAGLIVSGALVLPEVRAFGAQLLALTNGEPEVAEVAAAMTEAGARHNAFASTLLSRFQWILAGYGVAAAGAIYGGRARP
jgi:hypothetical protein